VHGVACATARARRAPPPLHHLLDPGAQTRRQPDDVPLDDARPPAAFVPGQEAARDAPGDRETEHAQRQPPRHFPRLAVARHEGSVHDVQRREHDERLRRPVVQPAHDPPALLDELHVVHARPRGLRRRAVRRHQRDPRQREHREARRHRRLPSPQPTARHPPRGDRSSRAWPCASRCAPPSSPRDAVACSSAHRRLVRRARFGSAGSRRARSRPRPSCQGVEVARRRAVEPPPVGVERRVVARAVEARGARAQIDRAPEVRAGHAPGRAPRRPFARSHAAPSCTCFSMRPRVAMVGHQRHALRLAHPAASPAAPS
jgi:hypothetical protein